MTLPRAGVPLLVVLCLAILATQLLLERASLLRQGVTGPIIGSYQTLEAEEEAGRWLGDLTQTDYSGNPIIEPHRQALWDQCDVSRPEHSTKRAPWMTVCCICIGLGRWRG
jgi:hypothetical protein